MESESLIFEASEQVLTSETDQYIELVNRVCYYNYPNANGVQMNYDENSLALAQKLIDQPVQGKYTINSQGEPTFKGHGLINTDGEITFDVANIGIHKDVFIEESTIVAADGTTQTLPCLYAKQIVWTLYHNYVAAVKRLYNEGKLHNSWVITDASYDIIDGVKHLKDYLFRANTFLGYEYADPAYGKSAEVIELSGKLNLEMSEALAKDIRKGEIELNKKEIFGLENSTLTVAEFYSKLDEAVQKLNADKWSFVSNLFPNEKIIWCNEEGNGTDELTEYSYTLAENEVSVEKVSTIKPAVDLRKINEVLAEKDSMISEKSDGIISLNTTISELKAQNAELSEIQKKYLEIEGERIEAERQENITKLKNTIESTKLFSAEEIETEFSEMLENLDEVGIKCKIADKITSNLTVVSEEEKEDEVVPKFELSNQPDPSVNYEKEFDSWLGVRS